MTRPILVVAFGTSIHTWRWLQLVRGAGRPIVLLPVVLLSFTHDQTQPELAALPEIGSAAELERLGPNAVAIWRPRSESTPDELPPPIALDNRDSIVRGADVAEAVRALRPVLLHSMEVQWAGYACLRASELLGSACPPWLVSNWGSDLFLYRKLAAHRPVLENIARRMDGSLNECARDYDILRSLGFRGATHHVMPASGGIDFSEVPPLADLPAPSARRRILVKGYHGWSGRAQNILSALHLAAAELRRFQISVILASTGLAQAIRCLSRADGLDIVAEPWEADHKVALQRLTESRMMVGIGISDGIGTSMLEAMAAGAFPIVACTSCADEWFESGRHGVIVDPHDTGGLADAIRMAVADDALVDAAAGPNRHLVERRWDRATNRMDALEIYASMIRSDV